MWFLIKSTATILLQAIIFFSLDYAIASWLISLYPHFLFLFFFPQQSPKFYRSHSLPSLTQWGCSCQPAQNGIFNSQGLPFLFPFVMLLHSTFHQPLWNITCFLSFLSYLTNVKALWSLSFLSHSLLYS